MHNCLVLDDEPDLVHISIKKGGCDVIGRSVALVVT